MRILNGKVQFLIFTCFFAALLVCYTRYLLFVFQEDRYISAIKKSTIGTEDDLKAASEREWNDNVKPKFVNPHGQRFGDKAESPSLQIWSGCLHALRREGNYGDVPPFLDSFKTIAEERLISSGFFLRFLIGAMPGLGFVGTVIGIPGALMETGGVLSDELAKQQSGVTSVSLALAFAFDTTLIGLVFALIGQYIMFLLNAAEESVIQNASKACLSSFIGEAQAPDTEAPRYREATVSIEVDPFVEIMAKELAALHAGNAAKPPNLSSRPLCTLSAASTPASYDEKFAKENKGPFRILTIVCLLVLMGMSLVFAIRHVVHWLLTLN
jgi:hypothetical protein